MRAQFAAALFVCTCLAGPAATRGGSQVLYVNANGPLDGDCLSWATACRSLQTALDLAASGDAIWVAAGTYQPTLGSDVLDPRSVTFGLKSGLSVLGGFAGGETMADQRDPQQNLVRFSCDLANNDGGAPSSTAENCYHVLTALGVGGDTLVDGVSIVGGKANGLCCGYGYGGGLHSVDSSLVLRGVTFRQNSALRGGAVWLDHGVPTFDGCTFEGNSAGAGGAMELALGSSATVRHCIFSGNSATDTGGALMLALNSNPMIVQSGFMQNSAARGGAVAEDRSSAQFTDCRFEHNAAIGGGGGGLGGAAFGTTERGARYVRCLFLGNSAGTNGGAVRMGGAQSFSHCRFLGNRANGSGGALRIDDTDPTVDNCLFSGNLAQVVGGAISAHASTLFVKRSTFSRNSAGPIDDSGNCCAGHGSPGCVDPVCEQAVCDEDAYCCGNFWDGACAALAAVNEWCDCGGDPGFGGGIHLSGGSNLTLGGSILFRNHDDGGYDESAQVDVAGGGIVQINYSLIQGWTGVLGGTGNIDGIPQFVNSRGLDSIAGTLDDNVRLEGHSPCINAGNPDFDNPGAVDLDGHARVLCGRIDMGAYELGIGDADCDGAIGLSDMAILEECLNGPGGGGLPAVCAAFDFGGDGIVDLSDLAYMQRAFTGAD